MSGGGGGREDSDMTLFLLVGLIFVLCWGIWVGAKQPLIEVIRGVKWIELSIFQLFDPALAEERKKLETLNNNQQIVKELDTQASKAKRPLTIADYEKRGLLAPDVMWAISNRIGSYTRWPIAAVLIGFAVFYMFYSKKTKFRTAYDLEGLIHLQAKQWPVITPIVNFNPTDANARNPGDPVPVELPLFSEALSPEEWIVHNQIPIVTKGAEKAPDKDAMRRAFLAQLGPRWTGLDCLTTAQRCLFAGFALKGAQKRRESDTLLGQVSLAWNHKSDFMPTAELLAEVNRILNNEDIVDPALKIANNFAYRTTAMLGLLKWARERGGVLAPASFLWLRGHDRALWYPLNNMGRRSYHAEASGAMSHYMAEKAAGRPLPIPRLDTALFTMTQYWGREEFKNTNGPVLPPLDEGKKKKKS